MQSDRRGDYESARHANRIGACRHPIFHFGRRFAHADDHTSNGIADRTVRDPHPDAGIHADRIIHRHANRNPDRGSHRHAAGVQRDNEQIGLHQRFNQRPAGGPFRHRIAQRTG